MLPNIQSTSYFQLPAHFYEKIAPIPLTNPSLVQFNYELANSLDQHNTSYNEQETLAICSGNWLPNHLQSIALAYAGHQFGHYVPLLGDGRAVTLGEICSTTQRCWDVQLKGSGRTKFSRSGDGRAPLSAVLREYLISEAMHGLNIPTTRSLAAIASDEKIYRHNGFVSAGVLTRIASSNLRVGSFEYAAAQKDLYLLKTLADYALKRHFPELLLQETPYLELFKAIVDAQAYLIAEWMGVGFIHGVMNTDNMAISGETLDYGPCAFIDEFDLNCVYSSIDITGRYAFGQQANIAHWNLAILHLAMLPLFTKQDQLKLHDILNTFPSRFHYYWHNKIKAKLGLQETNTQTIKLIENFLDLSQQHKPDFTNTFRLLNHAIDSLPHQNNLIKALGNHTRSKQWVADWSHYIVQQSTAIKEIKNQMNQVNPAYIPRNHLVERAINNLLEQGDRTLMDTLLTVLKKPYTQQENIDYLHTLPQPGERITQTFCGT